MRYLIAGGGTGGHIIPALNIARAIQKIDLEAKFTFVGSKAGLEETIVKRAGFTLEYIDASPWRGVSSLKNLLRASAQARRIVKKFSADAVIGTGGYVSAPAIVAAAEKGKKLFIQEQNTYPGLATKLGSLFAQKVFLGFPEAKKFLWRKKRAEFTGNPVMFQLPNIEQERARRNFGLSPDIDTILLTGGSQGASALNEAMKLMLETYALPAGTQLIWQCGSTGYEALGRWLASKDLPVALRAFINDMGIAYKAADIVIARAGALTLAEIAIAGLPAILIPYPHATAEHQLKNAMAFVRAGAAVIIHQSELTPALLIATIKEVMMNPRRRKAMGSAVKSLAKPDAAKVIAKKIVETLENN